MPENFEQPMEGEVSAKGPPLSGESLPLMPRPWGFWMTLAFSAVILGAYILVQVGVLFVVVFARVGALGTEGVREYAGTLPENGFVVVLATLLSAAVGVALVMLFAGLRRGIALCDYLALVPVRWRVLLGWLALCFLMMMLMDLGRVLTGDSLVPDIARAWYATARYPWLLWLTFVVLAPVFEESLFRGFMMRGWLVSLIGAAGTVVLTALAWSLLHRQYNVAGMVTIFLFGLLLGVARVQTGSLYVVLAMHAFNNLVATLETAVVAGRTP